MEAVIVGGSGATRRRSRTLARLGFVLAAAIAMLAVTTAVALVALCVTRPDVAAGVIEEGRAIAVVKVVAALVVSALARAVQYL